MSDNSLIVVTGASCVSGTMDYYLSQLKEADIEVYIHALTGVPHLGYGLGFKVDYLRSYARKFSHYRKIIFSDAWDVTFYGTKEDVYSKIPTNRILWAAEKNCYPNPSIAVRVPDSGPWRYANGGLVCGTPQSFIDWADKAEIHPAFNPAIFDQQFLNERLADGSDLCSIDHRTELFFCLYLGYPELDFEKGIPVNTLHGTHPNFLHRNGAWSGDEMFAKYERSLL